MELRARLSWGAARVHGCIASLGVQPETRSGRCHAHPPRCGNQARCRCPPAAQLLELEELLRHTQQLCPVDPLGGKSRLFVTRAPVASSCS